MKNPVPQSDFYSRVTVVRPDWWLGLAAALCWGLAAVPATLQADDPPKQAAPTKAEGQPPATAPWQRLLTGEDAKRVADMEAKLAKLQEAGSLPEAVAVARAILEVRTQRQGADHWQTVDARWQLKTLQNIENLPVTAQKEWACSLT